MKIYLSGKITGDPNYKEKFSKAEEKLKSEGLFVINPSLLPFGLSDADYMRICFAMIDCADMVAFMLDWPDSRGARLENEYCQYVGKHTYYLGVDNLL